jgi:excisionase family DNA binding protein
VTEATLSLANNLIEAMRAEHTAEQKPVRRATGGIEPRLMTVPQAAFYIARTEQAVRHLIFNRDLPVIRAGRNVRLDRRDLDSYIENNRC